MLGDTFDTKEVVRGKALNLVYNKLKQSKLEWIFIIGNHDLFNLSSTEHSLETLKELKNVSVIDKITVKDNLVFIPYTHDIDKLRMDLARVISPDRVAIAHLELKQFDFGNGHICTSGLTAEDVAGFKRVISGHFHKYQTSGNLTYLGTPFSHSFGEANQTKYLGLYNIETDELKIAETPFARHISIEFNCDLLDDRGSHWLFDTSDPQFKNNYYRVILTGTQENIDRFPKFIYDQGGAEGKLNIKWISRPSDFIENDVIIEDTASNERQFIKWAIEVKNMDETTVNLGLAIMEACR
jgi:DNA repair exonuclease SbcCD nuclease subunit